MREEEREFLANERSQELVMAFEIDPWTIKLELKSIASCAELVQCDPLMQVLEHVVQASHQVSDAEELWVVVCTLQV